MSLWPRAGCSILPLSQDVSLLAVPRKAPVGDCSVCNVLCMPDVKLWNTYAQDLSTAPPQPFEITRMYRTFLRTGHEDRGRTSRMSCVRVIVRRRECQRQRSQRKAAKVAKERGEPKALEERK